MKRILDKKTNYKAGFTLVEIIIATAVLTIISSAIIGVLYSSKNVTENNEKDRIYHEIAVGVMDSQLKNIDPALGAANEFSVDIEFQSDGTHQSVDCAKIYESDLPLDSITNDSAVPEMHYAGVVKKK